MQSKLPPSLLQSQLFLIRFSTLDKSIRVSVEISVEISLITSKRLFSAEEKSQPFMFLSGSIRLGYHLMVFLMNLYTINTLLYHKAADTIQVSAALILSDIMPREDNRKKC